MAKTRMKTPRKTKAPAAAPPAIRDRIKELRRVRAGDLIADPRNWRVHSADQQKALEGILGEVGFADALLARERGDGKLILIDGHLRASTTPEALVPVLVLDVNEEEAAKLLATLDPLAGMAATDVGKLDALLEGITFETPELGAMLERLKSLPAPTFEAPAAAPADAGDEEDGDTSAAGGRQATERFAVLVNCESEDQQRELLERFEQEGLACRALIV